MEYRVVVGLVPKFEPHAVGRIANVQHEREPAVVVTELIGCPVKRLANVGGQQDQSDDGCYVK